MGRGSTISMCPQHRRCDLIDSERVIVSEQANQDFALLQAAYLSNDGKPHFSVTWSV
jgi:hypothetical protein